MQTLVYLYFRIVFYWNKIKLAWWLAKIERLRKSKEKLEKKLGK